jgi:arsenate reductase (thioredoxin)
MQDPKRLAAPFDALISINTYAYAYKQVQDIWQMYKILFLCTGNSCRSIIGEALLNHLGKGRIEAYSAGSHPTGKVNPNALAILKEHGIPTEGYTSKSWEALEGVPIDIVITVCDQAAGETCPAYLGKASRAHWGLPDPAGVNGSEEDVKAAFRATFDALKRRVERLLALPLESLSEQELVDRLNEIDTIDG